MKDFRGLYESVNDIISEEKVNIEKMIKDLSKDFSGTNEDQLAGVQLLKGLALSDDPKANRFMKELDLATTRISKKILETPKEE